MKNPTIGELRALHQIDGGPPAHRAIILMKGHLEQDWELTWPEFLEVALRRYLMQINLDADVVMKLLGTKLLADIVNDFLLKFEQHTERDLAARLVHHVMILDGCWLTWSGQTHFYHVATGDKVKHLGRMPLESLTLNLVSLWFRSRQLLEKVRGDKDDHHATATATSEVREAKSDLERRGYLHDDPDRRDGGDV